MKIGNSSFEREEEFRNLETNLTNHNSVQEVLAVICAYSSVFQFPSQKYKD